MKKLTIFREVYLDSLRFHSNKMYVYVFLIVYALAVIHLAASLIDGIIPQTVAFMINPKGTPLLRALYTHGSDMMMSSALPFSYLFRNLSLRYFIYPMLTFTFMVDHFGLAKHLRFITWKTLALGIVGGGAIITAVSHPYLDGAPSFPSILLYQVGFVDSSAAFYIYALAGWILLIALSFKMLHKKLPTNGALWITFLIFSSAEEVWEYAPYIALMKNISFSILPPIHIITLYLWRATPTMLLLFYSAKWGVKNPERLSNIFLAAITMSVLTIILPQFYNSLSLLLRIAWVIAYLAFAHYLNPPAEAHPVKIHDSGPVLFTGLLGVTFILGLSVRGYYLARNAMLSYALLVVCGIAGAILYLKSKRPDGIVEREPESVEAA